MKALFPSQDELEADGIAFDRGTMASSTEDIGACLGASCWPVSRTLARMLSVFRLMPPESRSARNHFQTNGGNAVEKAALCGFGDRSTFSSSFNPSTPAPRCTRWSAVFRRHPTPTPFTTLFRSEAVEASNAPPSEVARWARARRRLWEAAVSGFAVGREALLRVRRLYELGQAWSKLPPSARLHNRKTVLAPFVDEFLRLDTRSE